MKQIFHTILTIIYNGKNKQKTFKLDYFTDITVYMKKLLIIIICPLLIFLNLTIISNQTSAKTTVWDSDKILTSDNTI